MTNLALEKILTNLRANPYTAAKSIEQLRDESDRKGAQLPMPAGATHHAVSADGVAAEWIDAPGVAANKVFLFFHGGGYYRGSVASSRAPAARIAGAAGTRCLSVEYRLAPEHPFPAAVEDALTAYRWLLAQGLAPGDIVVGGISAGGGLTLSLLLTARDHGVPMPAAAVLLSAWTDLTQSSETFVTHAAADPMISKPYLDRMANYYLGSTNPEHPLASPLYAQLADLPPLLVQVGTAETLLDDSRRLADKAEAFGVDVTLEIWDDMFHGWHGSAPDLPEAQRAIDAIGAYCRTRLSY